MQYLVETALLTHGLSSISNMEILRRWPNHKKNIVFIEKGHIRIDDIEAYLTFRVNMDMIDRVDMHTLDDAVREDRSAALTASATMRICADKKVPFAVTAGMGGIGAIKGEELCPDLPALEKLNVKLISCGPKDMLDRQSTFEWLKDHDVTVTDFDRGCSTGYVFCGDPIALPNGLKQEEFLKKSHGLWIHEIPQNRRIRDKKILQIAVDKGYEKQAQGENFHPAVNAALDMLTEGRSSMLQLDGLISNIEKLEETLA